MSLRQESLKENDIFWETQIQKLTELGRGNKTTVKSLRYLNTAGIGLIEE